MKISNLPDCFETDLVLRWVSDGHWDVAEPFIVISKKLGRIEIPVGTHTDGPSIPKIPIIYEKYRDRAWPAAVPHDFGYDDDCPYDFPREAWDDLFHELMDELYPGWIARIENDKEWAGVRLGGGPSFRKDDE